MIDLPSFGAPGAIRETEAREQQALDALHFAFVKGEFVKRLTMISTVTNLSTGSPTRLDSGMPAAEIRAQWQRNADFMKVLVDGLVNHAATFLSVIDEQIAASRQKIRK